MHTLYTVGVTASLCSLVWIGGTVKLLDEYIKVTDQKDKQILQLKNQSSRDRFTIMRYDNGLKNLLIACAQKQDIIIDKRLYICYPIEKA